jgi:hypothetical protein
MVTDSALQLMPCRRCSLDSTDFPSAFLSPFIRFFFSPLPLKPCGCCTCLIMMQNVRPHPTSTLLHDTFFSVTFECDCRFLWQVDVAGDGSTTINIKMNTKWLCNTSRSHPTSAWQVLCAFPSAGCRCWGWVYNNQKQNEYSVKWYWLKTIPIDIGVILFVSSVNE